jgi:hypothetical protein
MIRPARKPQLEQAKPRNRSCAIATALPENGCGRLSMLHRICGTPRSAWRK